MLNDNKKLILPDFICVGTFRAGTTWLHRMLSLHPKVFLPKEKEIMFFSHNYNRGIDWYCNFYHDASNDCLKGEICPTYLSNPHSSMLIKKHIPDVKIFAILRKPTEQILSMYKLILTRRFIQKSISEIVHTDPWIIQNVLYFKNLTRYIENFGNDQIKLFLYDDLKNDEGEFLKQVLNFLCLEPFTKRRINGKVNESRKPKIMLLDKIIAGAGKFLRKKNLHQIKILLSQTGVADLAKKLNTEGQYELTIPPYLFDYIMEKIYKDIKELEKYLGRDLSAWFIS